MNKIFLRIVVMVILLGNSKTAIGQLTGIWEVTRVMVGNTVRTPDAKWMKFEQDGTYRSGNGWQQHTINQYQYDAEKNLLYINDEMADEYGPYNVLINDTTMTWTRIEDNYEVNIQYNKITSLPKSTADKVRGLWKLKQAYRDSVNITQKIDPENKQFIYLRWDRRYIHQNTPEGQKTGFWYADPHYPDIELISDNKNIQDAKWRITFNGNTMTWNGHKGSASENEKMVFEKITRIPK